MRKFGLTMKQFRVLNFIRDRLAISEVSPTLVEIGAGCEIKSKSHVHYIVKALKERGYVDYLPHRERSIVVLDKFTDGSVAREAISDPAPSSTVPLPS